MTDHLCRLAWIPAKQVYQIVCIQCGETLVDDIDKIGAFLYPGDCQPGETLSISVSEKIGIKDKFGQ